MKQTAVQYFATRVTYLKISPKEMHDFLDWYEEAKEIEKEQMRECYENVFLDDSGNELNFEQYYNETYGKDA